VLIYVLQFYSETCVKRVFLMLEKNIDNPSLLLEARNVCKKRLFITKINWLKTKQSKLPADAAQMANTALKSYFASVWIIIFFIIVALIAF
jgi:hypothetical protein